MLLQTRIRKELFVNGPFTSEELLNAENILIHWTQQQFYSEEIIQLKKKSTTGQAIVKKSSSLYKLSPYLDENGLLRVKGRIDRTNNIEFSMKRPIILPKQSYLTSLIVQNYHNKFLHRNHEVVVNEIRQKFFIPKLRRVVNNIRNSCQF